jgi:hypothetical protein
MAHPDRNTDRPPLNPREVYRPRLGAQREPLSRKTMSELRAWREVSAQGPGAESQSGQTA